MQLQIFWFAQFEHFGLWINPLGKLYIYSLNVNFALCFLPQKRHSVLCIEQQHLSMLVSLRIFYWLLAATSVPYTFQWLHAICTAIRRQFATMISVTTAYLCSRDETAKITSNFQLWVICKLLFIFS